MALKPWIRACSVPKKQNICLKLGLLRFGAPDDGNTLHPILKLVRNQVAEAISEPNALKLGFADE